MHNGAHCHFGQFVDRLLSTPKVHSQLDDDFDSFHNPINVLDVYVDVQGASTFRTWIWLVAVVKRVH